MAFMVPLVKNHYDIYARNNPADHPGARPPIAADSLYLSTTSLKGGAPVTKQYRIVLTGGKIAPGKKNGTVLVNGSNKASLTQSPGGKLYYRMPSASISLPVPAPRAGSVPTGGGRNRNKISEKLKGAIAQQHAQKVESLSNPESPQSVSPPSRPLPHVRRTMRNPVTNRVYSYSVSIPDYVEEENEEDLEDEEDLDEEIDDSDLMSLEDKENNEDLLLFSTSAPAGTGSILSATPTPPPAKQNGNAKSKIANKKQAVLQSSHSMPSSPEASPAVSIVATGEPLHQRTHSSTSTSSNGSSQANSREYVELLRKFILHLKMLKIGGKSKKARRAKSLNASAAALNGPVTDVDEAVDAQRRQQRKRKDTMEDSKHL